MAAAPAPVPTRTHIPLLSFNNRVPVSIAPVSIKSVSVSALSINTVSISTSNCIEIITTKKDHYVRAGECGVLWSYSVNFSAAVFFSVAFGTVIIAHIIQAVMGKTSFCWVIIMAAIWEFTSYATRAAGAKRQQISSLATISQLFVLLAPIWVNAFNFMLFARMVHFFVPNKKLGQVHPSILAFIFISLNILSFMIQLVGGIMANPNHNVSIIEKGIHIYMGGIYLQEVFIIVFTSLLIKYHFDMNEAKGINIAKHGWKVLLYALYTSLLAITVRIVFQLVKFANGFSDNKPIPHEESWFYLFETVPMFTSILIWNIVHPGRLLVGPDAELGGRWLPVFKRLSRQTPLR